MRAHRFTPNSRLARYAHTYRRAWTPVSLAFALVACGGGDDPGSDPQPPPPPPPPPPGMTAPAAPTQATAAGVSSDAIEVRWTDNASNETGFVIARAGAPGGPFTDVGTSPANGDRFLDDGLPPETSFWYRVRATNGVGDSAPSNVAVGTTRPLASQPPRPPEGLTAQAVSAQSARLSWTDASDNETGFEIERALAASGPFGAVIVLGPDQTAWTDRGLTGGTTYYYRARASNAAGASPYAGPVGVTTPGGGPTAPAAPSDLQASAMSSTEIRLTWTDNSSNETGFEIERARQASGPFGPAGTVPANQRSFADMGLMPSTTYWYRVRASGEVSSPYTPVVSAMTSAPPVQIPTAPSDLTASAVSTSEIRLSWTDRSSDEAGFIIGRSSRSGGPWAEVHRPAADATSWTDRGLQAATRYYYRVQAFNAAGVSDATPPASATTEASQVCQPRQTRCIAGSPGRVQTCNAAGTAWTSTACGLWSMCSRSACRQVCGMGATSAPRTMCAVPNNDGVNDGVWLLWSDPLMATPTYTDAGAFSQGTTPSSISLESGEAWPYSWTVSTLGAAWIQFRLDQFGSTVRSPRMEARVRRAGIIPQYSNRFSAAAFNGSNTVVASGTFGSVPFSWTVESWFVASPANRSLSYDGRVNAMLLSIVGDGFGNPPDLMSVNWIKLVIP